MYLNKKILAIIPARGGSKGIPKKNLKKIKNISLVGRAIMVAKKIKEIDKIFVSTDSKEIIKEAEKFNILTPFIRPKNISGDKISDYQVIKHALKKIEKKENTIYEIIIMLQPTSPLRNIIEVKEVIKKIAHTKFDAIWTVSEVPLKYHPLKQFIQKKERMFFFLDQGKNIFYRQKLKKTLIRNGACYAIKRNTLIKFKNIHGINLGYIKSKKKHISIDSFRDLRKASKLIKK